MNSPALKSPSVNRFMLKLVNYLLHSCAFLTVQIHIQTIFPFALLYTMSYGVYSIYAVSLPCGDLSGGFSAFILHRVVMGLTVLSVAYQQETVLSSSPF